MRKIASVINHPEIKRIMLYECEDGVYLFEFTNEYDCCSISDHLQDSVEIVYEIAYEDYGVIKEDWIDITDPLEYCQHDRIKPVRVVGMNIGNPKWGRFEVLIEGSWIELVE